MSGFTSPGLRALERRRRIRQWVVILVLAAALAGSALLWPRPRHGALDVPTVRTVPTAAGVLTGTLTVTRAGGRVCVRVAAKNGTAFLRFPAGWSSDADLDVIDPSGSARARSGDPVRLSGEPAASGPLAPCAGTAAIWTVTRLDPAR